MSSEHNKSVLNVKDSFSLQNIFRGVAVEH